MQVSGRILVDFHGYQKYRKGLQRQSEESDNGKSSYIEPLSKEAQKKNKVKMLERQQDLICMSPMLSGFALKDKVWRKFARIPLVEMD